LKREAQVKLACFFFAGNFPMLWYLCRRRFFEKPEGEYFASQSLVRIG